MSVTVKHLRDHVLSALDIDAAAGIGGLDREVNRVTVMETMDFSKGARAQGLFVLTTLYTVTLDRNAAIENVHKLFQNHLAGMCIKLNRYLSEVPEEILTMAEQYQVPVFIVDRDILFSDLIDKLSSVLTDEKTSRMQFLFGQHERLMRAIAGGKSAEAVLGILSEAFRTGCYMIPVDGRILSPPCTKKKDEKWDETEKLRPAIIERSLLLSEEIVYFVEGSSCIFPCKISRRLLGCLVMEGLSTVNDSEIMLIGQVLAYLSIHLYEQLPRFGKSVQHQPSVLKEVLTKRHSSDWPILELLKHAGFEPEEYYAVITVSVRPAYLELYGYNLIEFCRLRMGLLFDKSVEKTELGQLTMIVSFPKGSTFLKKGRLASVLDHFRVNKLEDNKVRLDFGISLISTDLRELPDCYEQAKAAVRLGRAEWRDLHDTGGQEPVEEQQVSAGPQAQYVHDYTSFVVRGLLNSGKNSPEYRWILNEIVIPLAEYDSKKDSRLWETLDILIRGDSLKDAADQLFIHISTLRYRIEKIKQITGLDYFASEGRYWLHTAYIIYKDNVKRS